LGIVCNTMLFRFENKRFLFLSCPMTIYLCKYPVRFSSIVSHHLYHQCLVPLTLSFTVTPYS
jgi:hypothetical protein